MSSARRLHVVTIVVAFVTAAVLTIVVRESSVDIGLDIDAGPGLPPRVSPPHLNWGGERVAMKRIADSRFPRPALYELEVTARENSTSRGAAVAFRGLPEAAPIESMPADSWAAVGTSRDRSLQGAAGARLRTRFWWIRPLVLHFRRSPGGSVATFRNRQGSVDLDLYNPRRSTSLPFGLDPYRYALRYHASIPRRALSSVKLEFGSLQPVYIVRLYVGTARPLVASPEASILTRGGRPPWGRVVTDWRPADGSGSLPIGSASVFEQGGLATFLALFGATWLILSVLIVVMRPVIVAVTRQSPSTSTDVSLTPFALTPFLACLLPLLAVWGLYWAAFYPGTGSLDSYVQWSQARGLTALTNDHPFLHTLAIRYLSSLWQSPAAVTLFQVLALAFVVASGYALARRAGAPNALVALVVACTVLVPHTGMMAVVLWKDTLFAASILLLAVWVFRLLVDRAARGRTRSWVILGIILILVPCLRHNGIAASLGLLPALFFVFADSRRMVLLTAMIAVAGYGLVQTGVARLYGVPPHHMYGVELALSFKHFIDQDVPMTQEDYELLARMSPELLGSEWTLEPGLVKHLPHAYDRAFLEVNGARCRALGRSLESRYPTVTVRGFLQDRAYIYDGSGSFTLLTPPSELVETFEEFGFASRPLIVSAHDLLQGMRDRLIGGPLRSPLWLPAWHLYIALIVLVVALRRHGWRVSLVFLPVILNTLSLLLVYTNAQTRYQFPLSLSLGFLLLVAALPRNRARA